VTEDIFWRVNAILGFIMFLVVVVVIVLARGSERQVAPKSSESSPSAEEVGSEVMKPKLDSMVGSPVPSSLSTPSSSSSTESCPFCGETILAIAIKCKHCGSDLSGKAPRGLL
jgi:hypothetical protein